MRVGIFGGTFNPVHMGHLVTAETVRELYSLDRVIFVPAKLPVHKELEDSVSADERCHMVMRAIEDNPCFDVSRIEIDRISPSYTVLTLDELKKEFSDAELFLIIGADSYNSIHTWKDYREILDTVSIIVMKRNRDEIRNDLVDRGNILIADNPEIDISSTEIRRRIKNNMTVRYILPQKVIEYINSRGLYRS